MKKNLQNLNMLNEIENAIFYFYKEFYWVLFSGNK